VSVSSLAGVAPALIYAQTVDNQAVIACVLERYRIEHGGYPPSLDGLTLADGRPLPRDVMTGQAIHYRPTEDGRYALWSAGLTGIDHGGVRGTKLGQAATLQPNNENYAGDWVWDFRSEPVKR